MSGNWQSALDRWIDAGLIDAASGERIRSWEKTHEPPGRNRLAVIVFGLGGLLLIAGILLFVAANWRDISPGARMALVCAAVAALHIGGAYAHSKPALSTTLHAAGTGALGAGIFLSGQTFHLAADWPEGFLLWAIGAALGLYLLRDWPHVLYVAILVPLWLVMEVARLSAFAESNNLLRPAATFVLLLAIAYLTAAPEDGSPTWRKVLARLGAVGVIPSAILVAASDFGFNGSRQPDAGGAKLVLTWALAILLPIGLAYFLRRKEAIYMGPAVLWAVAIGQIDPSSDRQFLALLGLYALGSVGIVLWGLKDRSPLLVNVGVIGFALSILAFYFASSLFTKLGRALGLIVAGLLFIGGGWLLERTRRTIIEKIEEQEA